MKDSNREAFESLATDKFPIAGLGQFEKHNNGTYLQRSIRNMYEAWQAAKVESHKQVALYQFEINHLAQANEQWREKAAKAQAVHEWKDYELEKPNDGQKCLVIFESKDCEDAQRWMCIDEFNEGMFDFIANWEDQCASVALPAGSIISKVRAVCWATTNLSNAPLSFDQFYEAQEPAND